MDTTRDFLSEPGVKERTRSVFRKVARKLELGHASLYKIAPSVAGRAKTCWTVHREGDNTRAPLVIKDSWEFPERYEEGELLREATKKGVVNVGRYYYHSTVRVNDRDDDVQGSAGLLAALEGCMDGYEPLHTQASLLRGDISPKNLMEKQEKSLGAMGKTGTRALVAIEVLLDDKNHSFMHDLESSLMLFWICIYYDGHGKDSRPTEFESVRKLAGSKKNVVGDERDFLKIAEMNFTPFY
ncbi:uncharacterized protein BDR25DRAFT_330130 [Lindgomyces ingoldianus]|uniref:Uncharacterized protein n=1 Tax=Lindgomyces ingoldianus TaxID=673940 RepID=A0ACB6Q6S9_9PLEO|nr:uncharacterized protein BDR25DRAFT_330130 [Lindgomyces ingoldianus]KAF2462644.1 hypothetical protein BDR25DRAFT_330130 [Lindgomyces ingoldianus]